MNKYFAHRFVRSVGDTMILFIKIARRKKQIVIFAIIKMKFMLARREAKKKTKNQKGSEPIFPIKIM